ncbi:uncharacterized protein GGS25DRAFT_520232 [Hypoxylon fragiforme]|uniref:uncharacterized protein n=1 Tax=Hypoxylon fragiforme TaxID=63214 RepID=UPI0020C5E3B4|nr:uncharacterized protein GGS25DRAFT_520232 [Hypoxylon fragiforme]KAI2609439.1 hypothetical protein GGS25DRAFT_520232 [Hypoxylon fragiforme]
MSLPFLHPSELLPSGFTLSRCTPADTPGMTSVCKYLYILFTFMKAFPQNSAFTYWWAPSLPVMHAWQSSRIAGRFQDRSTQQFKVVDENVNPPAVVAFAKWDPPTAGMKGLREGFVVYDGREEGRGGKKQTTQLLAPPEGADEELYTEFFTGLKRMGEKWRAHEKLALSIICTDPAYHGRGIGAALISSVLALADAEGLTTYLEALPLAVPLYRRLGFVQVDTLEYDLARAGMEGTSVLTIMLREPKGEKEEKEAATVV